MPTPASLHVTRIEAAIRSGQAARSAVAASWARSATVYQLDPAAYRLDVDFHPELSRFFHREVSHL